MLAGKPPPRGLDRRRARIDIDAEHLEGAALRHRRIVSTAPPAPDWLGAPPGAPAKAVGPIGPTGRRLTGIRAWRPLLPCHRSEEPVSLPPSRQHRSRSPIASRWCTACA